jgi:predicted lysophospholipase L1 biosynthesis ABC-type transport system permease subunit
MFSGQNSPKEILVTLILVLIIGGIIGWLASMLMRTDAQQGVLLNVPRQHLWPRFEVVI